MSKFLVFLLSGALLLAVGCSKEEDETIYTIQGTLYEDCSEKPVANKIIRLYQPEISYWFGSNPVGGVLATTLTDEKGGFVFQFTDKGGLYQQIDCYTSSYYTYASLVEHLPTKTNLTGLSLYLSVTYSANIYLDVKNPYSSYDTLYYTDANVAKHRHITGPFHSQLLNKVADQKVLDMRYPFPKEVFQYWMNQESARLKYFPVAVCDTVDVTVVIE